MRIHELDVHDAPAVDAWYDVYAAAERHGREAFATVWQREEVRVLLQERTSRGRTLAWNGVVDGEVVAAGWMRLSLLDNLDRAELTVHVLPAHRRRGHGRAMALHLEEVARAEGRTILAGEATYAYDAGAAGAGEDGPEFARALGYDLALGDVQRALPLPVDDALLDRLAGEAAPHHAAYTLRSWVGPVPEELLAGWAELVASLNTEAPTGELDMEPETPSTQAVRENEAVLAKQGRTKFNTVAVSGAGEVVAYTDLAVTAHEPDRAYQWGTLVRRDHRGHRLGVAVKIANLRLLQAEGPGGLATLVTYNAEVNAPMIGVNEQLGFVPVARLGEFQKRL
jgi:RimJ/RimL family protein N-acetyltransferase